MPAEALLTVVRAMWTDLQASESATGAALLPVVDEGGQMLAGHLKALNKKAAKAHAALLQTALLVALQKMPAAHLQSLSGDLVRTQQNHVANSDCNRVCCHVTAAVSHAVMSATVFCT